MEQSAGKLKWARRGGIALGIYLLHYILFGYHFISGKVVDEETGKPIEGAVVLGVWTYQVGIGFTTTAVYKTEDAVSDKNGRFFIWGVWNPLINRWLLPFVDKADLTVYKRGYVAWNNIATWNDGPRKDFEWKNGLVVKMETWKEGHSFIEHEAFISMHTFPAMTKAFADAIGWEREQEKAERLRRIETRRSERGK